MPPGLSARLCCENHLLVWIFIPKPTVLIWSSEGTKQNILEEACQCAQKNQINLWQYECGKKEGKWERRKEGRSEGGRKQYRLRSHGSHVKKPEEDNPVSGNFFHPPAKIALLYQEALSFPSSFSLLCPLLPLNICFSLSGLVQNSSLFHPSCFAPCLPWAHGVNENTLHTSEQRHGAASRSCF